MIFIDKGSDSVTYFGGEIAVLSVDLDKINLDDVNFNEDDPQAIIHARCMTCYDKFKHWKPCKKNVRK